MDIATENVTKYLIIVDSYSGFIFVEKLPKYKISRDIAMVLKKLFSIYGKQLKLITDNEPLLTSSEIKNFCKENMIILMGTSSNHSVSNKM